MPKQTRLTEDAEIYKPRQELTEKQKLRDMNNLGRLEYLWEYYKLHALIGILAIGVIIYIIYNIVTPNVVTQFNAAIINDPIGEETWAKYETKFSDYLKLDPKTEQVLLNNSFYFNAEAQYVANMQTALTTYVAANELDVIIAPESYFKNYTYTEYMSKLSDELPTDIYSSLTDCMYLSDTEADSEKAVYGIYLNDTKLFKDKAINKDPYILGIVVNSKHKDNAVEFIRMLFSE
jgi:ABC-type molybdate transport system substrate-binding protein